MSESRLNPPVSLFDRPLPEGYRDELRALIAERPNDPPRLSGSMLLFQLGELRLALPTRVASAVAPVLHIARIPHRSGTVLLGLAAFRGEILPCCSLNRIFGLPEAAERAPSATARTLILEESAGRRWAVPIDGVLGVRVSTGEPVHETGPLAAQWLQGSFRDCLGDEHSGEDHSGDGHSAAASGVYHLLDPAVLFRQIALATA